MSARIALRVPGEPGWLIYPGDGTDWPEDWPVPKAGDAVYLYETARSPLYVVRVDEWRPEGADAVDEPFLLATLTTVPLHDKAFDRGEGR